MPILLAGSCAGLLTTGTTTYHMNRLKRIQEYGLEIVEQDDAIWRERGYIINPENGLLEPITK